MAFPRRAWERETLNKIQVEAKGIEPSTLALRNTLDEAEKTQNLQETKTFYRLAQPLQPFAYNCVVCRVLAVFSEDRCAQNGSIPFLAPVPIITELPDDR